MRRLPLIALALFVVPAAGAVLTPSSIPGFGVPVAVEGGVYGGEPNVLVAPSGAIYASNVYGDTWKSLDGGSSWAGTGYFLGGSTTAESLVDLACCGDFDTTLDAVGNLYAVGLGELVYSAVARSPDAGATWGEPTFTAWEDDRPWLAAGVGDELYLSYHDVVTQLVYVEKSTDGGKTFLPRIPATMSPDGLAFSLGNTLDGPLVRSSDGSLWVAWTATDPAKNAANPPYAGRPDRVFVSVASTTTPVPAFTTHLVTAPSEFVLADDSIVGFPWVTVDRALNAYVVWTGSTDGVHWDVWMSSSTDRGTTWSPPTIIHSGGTNVFPTAAAGSDGRLDVAWYGNPGVSDPNNATGTWDVHFAQSLNAHDAAPVFTETLAETGGMHQGGICDKGIFCAPLVVACGSSIGKHCSDRSLLDFFEIALDPQGYAVIAYADNGHGGQPHLMVVHQNAGPSALG